MRRSDVSERSSAEAETGSEADRRIERLSSASERRVIEPDVDVDGAVGDGAVLPPELLSVAGIDVELTPQQWVTLSREETASIFDAGVRFEAILMAGFGLMLAYEPDLTDPRVTYALHEIGEETRHSRLFVRVVEQLQPRADNPFHRRLYTRIDRAITRQALGRKVLFCIMVLTGEEGPDLLQRRSSEHPATDAFLREVNRYHRLEEARHLAYARTLLPELWQRASPVERWIVRHVAPFVMEGVFDGLVHPGVYRTVGLPGWRTWNRVRTSEARRELRAEAFRPVATVVAQSGAFDGRSRLPGPWRRVCRVDTVAQLHAPSPPSPERRRPPLEDQTSGTSSP